MSSVSGDLKIYILAGGKSSRMGSDKGLLPYHGLPMVRHVIDAVRPLGFPVSLIGASPAYNAFGLERIQDKVTGTGPAGGILSALTDAGSGRVLILPCDMPLVKTSWLKLLIEHVGDLDVLISESPGGPEPLCGVYSCSIRNLWEKSMLAGILKLTDLIRPFKTGTLKISDFPAEEQTMFTNINTPGDMLKWNDPGGMRVIAFGVLGDMLGGREIDVPHAGTVRELKTYLETICPEIRSWAYSVAVNQVISTDELTIQPGSEVALLPPFSGG